MKIKNALQLDFSSHYLLSTLRLSKIKNILLIVIAFYTSGCVMTPPEDSLTGVTYDEHQTHLKEVDENTARIYLYRKLSTFEHGRVHILIDDTIVGKLDEGSFIVVHVEAKTTRITIKNSRRSCKKHSITKNLEGGQEYYMRVAVNNPNLKLLPPLWHLRTKINCVFKDNVSTHHFIEKPKEDALIEMKSKMLYNKSYEYPELEI